MKKLIALLMIAALVMSLAACGNGNTEPTGTTAGQEEETTPEVQVPASAVEILENIWALYGEDEQFYAMGGDTVTPVDNAPGAVDVTGTDFLTYNLKVPEGEIANITDAASLIHGMLANNFTCGVYRVADAAAFAEAMRTSVLGTQWICGMPELITVAIIGGEYVLVAYGITDAIEPFNAHLLEAYPDAQIVCNDAVVE